jgi:hypothetical protein
LSLHGDIFVYVLEFIKLMKGIAGELTSLEIEYLAAAIHDTWRALAHGQAWPMQPSFDKPYAQLAPIVREETCAAARRIPEVLALIGLRLRRNENDASPTLPPDELKARLEQNLERLAEAEHNGWMAHRCVNGWCYGETRDDERKLHPDMLPYAQLPERVRDKCRNDVRFYPTLAVRAGYRIEPVV